jgi:hypothetical protein
MRPIDDIESLVYCLCYLATGTLPWQGKPDALAAGMKRVLLNSGRDSAPCAAMFANLDEQVAEACRGLWYEVLRCRDGDGDAVDELDYDNCLGVLGTDGEEAELGLSARALLDNMMLKDPAPWSMSKASA